MNTKIFLAGVASVKTTITPNFSPHYILESFMYLKSKRKATLDYIDWCLKADEFLLDSGAFTFMNKSKKASDYSSDALRKYIDDYIEFINKYDIKNFFEMDIDCIVGYEKVKEIRKYIEDKTNKRVVPVWHKSRGMKEFHNMCKEYKYVAVGGIAAKEIKPSEYDFLCELCNIAHSYGCKIHGLGYSPLSVLNERKCPFDTIDSTTWIGHRFGHYFNFKDKKLYKEKDNNLNWRELDINSFSSWVEFSKLSDVYKESSLFKRNKLI